MLLSFYYICGGDIRDMNKVDAWIIILTVLGIAIIVAVGLIGIVK